MLTVKVFPEGGEARVLDGLPGTQHEVPGGRLEYAGAELLLHVWSAAGVRLNGKRLSVHASRRLVEGDTLLLEEGARAEVVAPPTLGEEERGLVAAAQASDAARLVYADWLEGRGAVRSAEYLRLEVSLQTTPTDGAAFEQGVRRLRALSQQVSAQFRALVSRAELERCDARWRFKCLMQWEALERTDDARVRRCGPCGQDVVFCNSVDEARQQALEGKCVAVERSCARQPGDLDDVSDFIMGDIEPE